MDIRSFWEIVTPLSAVCTPSILLLYIWHQRSRMKDVETILKLIDIDKLNNLNNLQREYALLLVDARVDKYKREFKENVTPLIMEKVDTLSKEFKEQFDEMANVVYNDVILTREKGDRKELIETYLPKCKDIFIPILIQDNEL